MNDTVKPYTDEDLPSVRDIVARGGLTHCEVRRLLATLDERTRERDEANRNVAIWQAMLARDAKRLSELSGKSAVEFLACEFLLALVESNPDAKNCVEVNISDKDGPRAVVAITKHGGKRPLELLEESKAEAASLREEVARLRDHALTLDGQLHEAEAARAAAERRAEEARDALRRAWDALRRAEDASAAARAPASTPEGEPADTLGEPGPCGHEVTSPAPWCEECVRGGPVMLDQREGEPTVTVTIEEDDASSAAVNLGAARLHLEERARNTASDVCRYVFEAEAEALERVEMALEVAVAASRAARAVHPSEGEEVGHEDR